MSVATSHAPKGFAASDAELAKLLLSLRDAPLSSPALQVKSSAKAIAQTGAACEIRIDDTIIAVPTTTDMPALSGTVTNAKHNVFAFFQKYDGTRRTEMGTEAASRAAVVWPQPADGEALIGGVYVNPTGTGDFVGGTIALDDAVVVPNAVYRNNVGVLAMGTSTL